MPVVIFQDLSCFSRFQTSELNDDVMRTNDPVAFRSIKMALLSPNPSPTLRIQQCFLFPIFWVCRDQAQGLSLALTQCHSYYPVTKHPIAVFHQLLRVILDYTFKDKRNDHWWIYHRQTLITTPFIHLSLCPLCLHSNKETMMMVSGYHCQLRPCIQQLSIYLGIFLSQVNTHSPFEEGLEESCPCTLVIQL